jgi:hypothetical protein
MSECLPDCLRDDVAFRLERGARLAEVQRELIEQAPALSENERAALWLFACSYRLSGRSEAHGLIGSVAG